MSRTSRTTLTFTVAGNCPSSQLVIARGHFDLCIFVFIVYVYVHTYVCTSCTFLVLRNYR